jgi:hypothetical protein
MLAPVDPNEFVGQENTKTQTLRNPRRVCHPEKRNLSLAVNVLEWYHALEGRRQEKKERKGVPPSMTLPALSRDT